MNPYQDLIDAARQLLQATGHPLPLVIASPDGLVVTIAGGIPEAAPARPAACQSPSPAISEMEKPRQIHRRLLAAATATPVSAKRLIGLAGYQRNSYSQDAVTWLVRHRLLLHVPDGYCLPGSPAREREHNGRLVQTSAPG